MSADAAMEFSVRSQRGVCLLVLIAAIRIEASTLIIESDGSFEDQRPVALSAKPLMRNMRRSLLGSSPSALLESTSKKAARVAWGNGRVGKGRAGKGGAVKGRVGKGFVGKERAGKGRHEGKGHAREGRAGKGRAGKGRAGKGGNGRQGKGRNGRHGKGRAGKGRAKRAKSSTKSAKGGTKHAKGSNKRPKGSTSAKGRTKRPSVIYLQFGGSKHDVRKNEEFSAVGEDTRHQVTYLIRPEGIKSKACNASGCKDCSDPAKCFHGVDEAWSGGQVWGFIVLDVPSSSISTHYVAEVWVRCPTSSSDAQLWLEIHKIQNGRLKVFENEKVVDPRSFINQRQQWRRWKGTKISITGEDNTRLRVFFYPIHPAKRSVAKIYLEGWRVDASVAVCMGVKNCLDLMGDGSDAAFKLRNGNGVQLKCLRGDQSGMSEELKRKCKEWEECVSRSGKKPQILAILKAALSPNARLLEGASVANATRLVADSSTCVEPSVDDPESWDCQCAEDMIATCSGGAYAGQELEECIKTLMCGNSNVCCSWKRDHCASPICTGALMEERSQVSNAATSIKLHNDLGLESTVQGKCTSETQ